MIVSLAAWLLVLGQAPHLARIAIQPIVVKESAALADAESDALYREIARALAFALDLEPVSREELGPALENALLYCASDLGCVAGQLRGRQIELALQIIVNTRLDPPLVTAQLIDARAGRAVASAIEEAAPAGPSLPAIIPRLVERVLSGAGRSIGGGVKIAVRPAEAELSIEPLPSRRSEDGLRFVAPPGVYRVRATRPGYQEVSREVTVVRGTETALALELDPERSVFASPWLWGGVGALAVAGGVLTFVLLRSPERSLCQAADPAQCR